MSRQRLRESNIKWALKLSNETFALKIIKLVELKTLENNAKIIKELVNNYNVNILSINALQKFNIWNKERKEELISLSEFAKKCDCKGIVLVPLNTGEFINKVERIKLLYNSLKNITPILNDYGLLGYIEPLGFEISSLRLKSEVAELVKSSLTAEKERKSK